MRKKTFRGGIHPDDCKALTRDMPVCTMPAPPRVVVPLRQHSGAPARALVKAGDRVAEGQPIGEEIGFVSVPVHAPIAGEVVSVASHPHPGGFDWEAVTIRAVVPKPEDESPPAADPAPWRIPEARADWEALSPDALRNIIRQAGIVGMGGAAFPAHVKLAPPSDRRIDTLIINGAECEPYLTCDHRVMLENTRDVVTGVRILRHILGIDQVLVGIEDNKPDAIVHMTAAFQGVDAVTVVPCRVKYPQGAERQLIEALTKRQVPPPPGLPMDVGVVVQNVGTAAAVTAAVTRGEPFIERVITLSGSAITTPMNVRVRLGTLLSDVVAFAGGLKGNPGKVIMGGPMMGIAQVHLDVPVIKGCSGFVFLSPSEARALRTMPCIRCGRCGQACPLHLQPSEISAHVDAGDYDGAEALHLRDCMECGCCSFVCPSARWLVQSMRLGKVKLYERKQKSTG